MALCAALFLFSPVGCQSGRVSEVQISCDGSVLVFRDAVYDVVYLATADGIRRLREGDRYVLSPNGRWLLVFKHASDRSWDFACRTGDELVLVDLRDGDRFETRIPFDIPYLLVSEAKEHSPRGGEQAGERHELRELRPVRICFKPDAEVIFGPVWDDYWLWRPRETLQSEWVLLEAAEASELLPSEADSVLLPSHGGNVDCPACVVEMPCDGWNALRTIWVRPDGSTMELVRQNDAPLRLLGACAVTIISPAAAFKDYHTGSIGNQIMLSLQMPLFWACTTWAHALSDLAVDQEALEAAQDELRRVVEARRRDGNAGQE